jgi:hypothetical protein
VSAAIHRGFAGDTPATTISLPSCNGSDDQERFGASSNRVRQQSVWWFMRQVFAIRKKSNHWPAQLRDVIAYRSPQHRILHLDRIENRALCNRILDFKCHFAVNARERAQMRRKDDAYQVSHVEKCSTQVIGQRLIIQLRSQLPTRDDSCYNPWAERE